MTINLIKLCVGADRVDDLVDWQQRLLRMAKGTDLEGYAHHTTRMFPKRRDELLAGGSMYWVVAGQIQVRQRILDLREVQTNDGRKCMIVLDPDLFRTRLIVRKPFQGWRYLETNDAPADLEGGEGGEDLPIRAELAELGLL